MKQFSVAFLLMAFVLGFVAVPDNAYAKRGGDDDSDHSSYSDDRDDDYDEDEDEDEDEDSDDDDRDDDSNSSGLEVEADVFTDMTIVKVELENGRKTTFRTDADTEAEVVDVVVTKFGLSKSVVEAVIDFEVEDRASRAQERAKLSFTNNRPVDTCDDSTSTTLEVEADVFTNTTIVKVEKSGVKTVFETTATTSNAVAEAVVARISGVTLSEVKAVIDFEVEDRASRASDFTVSSNSNDDCDDNSNNNNNTSNNDAALKSRIAELQKLIEALLRLLNTRFGN